MINFTPFEITTIDGSRFRCNTPGHFWQYGLVEGTMDVLDKTIVEVHSIDANEETLLMKREWAEKMVENCEEQGVPIWFKQHGGNTKDKGGFILNGREYKQWPRGDV
jgi:protein gp37